MKYATIIVLAVFVETLAGCATPLRGKPAPVTSSNTRPIPTKPKPASEVEVFPYRVETPGAPMQLVPRSSPTTPRWSEPAPSAGTSDTPLETAPTQPVLGTPDVPVAAPPLAPAMRPLTPSTGVKPNLPPRKAAPAPSPAVPAVTKAAPTVTAGQPAQALLKQAEALQAGGDLTAAAATLERGLRIEPRNPYLWNRLARVRLAQGQAAQASNLAAKSNALAGKTPALLEDNARIMTQSRQAEGH